MREAAYEAASSNSSHLAVVNLVSVGLDAGSLLIYPGATGTTTQELTDPNLEAYYFAGYDPSGNLYVNGLTGAGSNALAEGGQGNPIGDMAEGVVGRALARMEAAGGAPTNFVDSGLVDPVGAALSTK